MTDFAYKSKLSDIFSQQKSENCEIVISDLIDKDHLNPIWYGGEVGRIIFDDGYTVTIEARGDIRIEGRLNGEEFSYTDKSNGGSIYGELGVWVDDHKLSEMEDANSLIPNSDYITYGNNNWFEFNVITPDDEFIDCCEYDNLLEDDLLGCFEDLSYYKEIIDFIKSEQTNSTEMTQGEL